jgi:hypothetical protein
VTVVVAGPGTKVAIHVDDTKAVLKSVEQTWRTKALLWGEITAKGLDSLQGWCVWSESVGAEIVAMGAGQMSLHRFTGYESADEVEAELVRRGFQLSSK